MNILIVHPCKGFFGGAEEVVSQLSNYIIGETNNDVFLVTKEAPKELLDGFPGSWFNTETWKEFALEAGEASNQADSIICFNFPSLLVSYKENKPIVWYCNEPPELFTNWKRKPLELLKRILARRKNVECVVADFEQGIRFSNLYRKTPSIIPYGIDYEFWSKGKRVSKEWNYTSMLQVGTISPYKNQLYSLRLLEDLLENGIKVHLDLVGPIGDYKYYDKVREYVEKPIFKNKVSFRGNLPREHIRNLYLSSDVLLHPVESQGGWLVPFEAICTRLPVIVDSSTPSSSIIRENNLGIISGSLRLLSSRIVPTGEYNPGEEELERRALWVKDNLTWEKFSSRLLGILEGKTKKEK